MLIETVSVMPGIKIKKTDNGMCLDCDYKHPYELHMACHLFPTNNNKPRKLVKAKKEPGYFICNHCRLTCKTVRELEEVIESFDRTDFFMNSFIRMRKQKA